MTGSIFHIGLSTPCWLGQGAARLHGRMRLKSCCESFGKTCCSMFNWNNCDVDKFDSLWFQMYLQLFLSVYRFVLIRLSANTMVHDGTSIYFENLRELGLTHELFTMLLPGALQGELGSFGAIGAIWPLKISGLWQLLERSCVSEQFIQKLDLQIPESKTIELYHHDVVSQPIQIERVALRGATAGHWLARCTATHMKLWMGWRRHCQENLSLDFEHLQTPCVDICRRVPWRMPLEPRLPDPATLHCVNDWDKKRPEPKKRVTRHDISWMGGLGWSASSHQESCFPPLHFEAYSSNDHSKGWGNSFKTSILPNDVCFTVPGQKSRIWNFFDPFIHSWLFLKSRPFAHSCGFVHPFSVQASKLRAWGLGVRAARRLSRSACREEPGDQLWFWTIPQT